MGRVWKTCFSFSSLIVGSFIGILAFVGAQRNEETLGVVILIIISSLILLTLSFFLIKVIQKKPQYWIRIVNRTFLVFIALVTFISLLMLMNIFGKSRETDVLVILFLVMLVLWGLFASMTLMNLLNTEKESFKERNFFETIISIDKKITAFGNKFIEKYPVLAIIIALIVVISLGVYVYVILGVPMSR